MGDTVMSLNVREAVRKNQRHARELGWQQHWGRISREFHSHVLNGEELAEAIAQWQFLHRPQLESDGVLGSISWPWMAQAIAPISRAVTANRRLARELGWERQYAQLAEFFDIRSSSNASARRFALKVFLWQTEHGLLADGIIGPETLSHLEQDVLGRPIERQWARFVTEIRARAKSLPAGSADHHRRARNETNTAISLGQTLLSAAGVSIPKVVDISIAANTANSPGDFIQGQAEGAVTGRVGGLGGPIVGNFWNILKGTNQALQRSSQMVEYLLFIGGYVDSLARCCVAALRDPVPYTRPPITQITDGQVQASAWKRRAWNAGVQATASVIAAIDNIRPTHGDHYSKRCFIQLARQVQPYVTQAWWRLRVDTERYILGNILDLQMQSLRNRLRRWANSR
jgi:hypothetical protein